MMNREEFVTREFTEIEQMFRRSLRNLKQRKASAESACAEALTAFETAKETIAKTEATRAEVLRAAEKLELDIGKLEAEWSEQAEPATS